MWCLLLPFLLMLLAGLLGYWLGRIWGNSGYDELKASHRELSDQYGSLDGKYKGLNSQYTELEGKHSSLNASYGGLQTQLGDAKSKLGLFDGLKRDKTSLNKELSDLRRRYEDLEARQEGDQAVIADLEEALKAAQADKDAALRTASTASVVSKPTEVAPVVNFAAGNEELEAKLKIVRAKNDELNKEFNQMNQNFASLQRAKEGTEGKLKDSTEENARLLSRIRDLESRGGGKSDLLKAEIDALKTKLADCNKRSESLSAKAAAPVVAAAALAATVVKEETPAEDDKSEDAVLERVKAKAANLNFSRIGAGDSQDDLKRISGIGPFLEKKLYALGITSFRQIANFNDEDEEMVNEAIEFFPGRVKRDEWVRQAKELLGEGDAKAEEAPASKEDETLNRIREKAAQIDFETIGTASESDKDDLKEIKGIGPFIEKKLNALGIYTFLQLSKLTPDLEDKVNDAIEFFPGRVKRDDWKGQAGELHAAKG